MTASKKAFASVDHILKDLGLELTEENRRSVRILGYNQMEMTVSNVEAVREADRQVQDVLAKLTPAATLKMIRDGFNPLEKSIDELETYFRQLPPEYKKEAESYSRFLYGLERNNEITPEERESYIGIYRLVRQIEKAEGAAVGALVNSQAELHFSNLLTALQNRKKTLDIRVPDELGNIPKPTRREESISEQISKAFVKTVADIRAANAAAERNMQQSDGQNAQAEERSAQESGRNAQAEAAARQTQAADTARETQVKDSGQNEQAQAAELPKTVTEPVAEAFVKAANDVLTEVSPDEKTTKEYNKTQLEEQRQAVNAADQESVSVLQRGELSSSVDNLMAAQALTYGTENIFALSDRNRPAAKKAPVDIMALLARKANPELEVQEPEPQEETGSTALWKKLDNMEEFVTEYGEITESSMESVEEATFQEADSSMDVKQMQLNHKQLTVAAALAKREEYYLPMYVGDRLTRVHLYPGQSQSGEGDGYHRREPFPGRTYAGKTYPEQRNRPRDAFRGRKCGYNEIAADSR